MEEGTIRTKADTVVNNAKGVHSGQEGMSALIAMVVGSSFEIVREVLGAAHEC